MSETFWLSEEQFNKIKPLLPNNPPVCQGQMTEKPSRALLRNTLSVNGWNVVLTALKTGAYCLYEPSVALKLSS